MKNRIIMNGSVKEAEKYFEYLKGKLFEVSKVSFEYIDEKSSAEALLEIYKSKENI